tara:strand:- start:392 stop:1174 length:783 start_codon:yes stop_codon:yes gene_type:complete
MTEKLTYDPTPADQPEFSEDEQNSLEVADKLGQEEAKQYAGKFQNAEELENAYLELQKKLGSNDDEDVEVDSEENKVEYDESVADGVELITNASDEYYSNEGQLSKETMDKFGEMSSQDLVNAYMAIQQNNPLPEGQQYPDLTDAEMNTIYNSAGGERAYEQLVTWAGDNLDQTKLDAFNNIVDQGNATAIQIALSGLKAEYENAEGYEGRMLTGKGARSADLFRSQAEVVAAMNDPRYDRDPAYRQDLYDKLERSNVAF